MLPLLFCFVRMKTSQVFVDEAETCSVRQQTNAHIAIWHRQ